MNRRRLLLLSGIAAVGLAVGTGVAVGANGAADRRMLPYWITIAGTPCSGMTADGAKASLTAWSAEQRRRLFYLVASPPESERRIWTARRGVLGAEPDLDAMVREAFAVASREGYVERVSRWLGRDDTVDIQPKWRVNKNELTAFLRSRVAPLLDRKPVDARFIIRSGRLSVSDDSPGLALDLEGAVEHVAARLTSAEATSADLPLRSLLPRVTKEDGIGIEAEIASFSTHYKERGNRKRNLQLACSMMNGYILKPGDVFSYNEVVGPREAEFGFRMAPVIVRGRMEPGLGGGVCQVSTTLYNAALRAGLGIVSRSHHAFPVHYVEPGLDATVVYGSIDLKIRNTTDHAVAIVADGANQKVTVRIFGSPRPGETVSIERTGISSWAPPVKTINDPSLPAGKRVVRDSGRAGHRVTVWRVYRQNGRVVRRELVSRDVYRAFPRIVAVGTRAASAPAGNGRGGIPGQQSGPNAPPAL